MCALYAVASIFASCANRGLDQEFPGLRKAVDVYYQAQQTGDWDRTYAMRTPKFRTIAEKPYYKEQMEADSQGWKLLQFRVLSAKRQGARVRVKMRFKYSVTESGKSRVFEFPDDSIWVQLNGVWYCHNAGIQYHLPQNDSFTRP